MIYSPRNVRVGEAFTKDRKSSALSREGLVDMVLIGYDRLGNTVTAAIAQMRTGLWCRIEARTASRLGIGQGARLGCRW